MEIISLNGGFLIHWFGAGFQGRDGYISRDCNNACPYDSESEALADARNAANAQEMEGF